MGSLEAPQTLLYFIDSGREAVVGINGGRKGGRSGSALHCDEGWHTDGGRREAAFIWAEGL